MLSLDERGRGLTKEKELFEVREMELGQEINKLTQSLQASQQQNERFEKLVGELGKENGMLRDQMRVLEQRVGSVNTSLDPQSTSQSQQTMDLYSHQIQQQLTNENERMRKGSTMNPSINPPVNITSHIHPISTIPPPHTSIQPISYTQDVGHIPPYQYDTSYPTSTSYPPPSSSPSDPQTLSSLSKDLNWIYE